MWLVTSGHLGILGFSWFFYLQILQVHESKGRQTIGSHWKNMTWLRRTRFTSILLVYPSSTYYQKNKEWHLNYNRGLLQGIAVGWPFRLACKVVESLLRSLPVFNCVFKYTICLYQDYTHLSVKGYPAISCPFQTCSEARAISRPFQQFSSESPRTSGIARGDVLLVPWCHQLQLRFLVLVFIVVMHAPLFGT